MTHPPSKLARILGCDDTPEALEERAKFIVESLRIHADAFDTSAKAKLAGQLVDSISDTFGCDRDDFDALFEHWERHAEAMGRAGQLLDALEIDDDEPIEAVADRIEKERAEVAELHQLLDARFGEHREPELRALLDALMSGQLAEALRRAVGTLDRTVVEEWLAVAQRQGKSARAYETLKRETGLQHVEDFKRAAAALPVLDDCKLFLGATGHPDVKAKLAVMARTLATIEMVLAIDPGRKTFDARWKGIFDGIMSLRDIVNRFATVLPTEKKDPK